MHMYCHLINSIKIVYILGNGKMDKNMDMENYTFQITVLTLVSFLMVRLKEKDDFFILTEIYI